MKIFHAALLKGLLFIPGLLWLTQAQAQMSAPGLTEIQDRMMIEDLMSRYEWALDSGNADAYGLLFADDGVLISGTRETRGRAAITQEVRDLVARFQAATQSRPAADDAPPREVIHSYSNVIIELDGDKASASSNWVEVWNIRDGSAEVGAAGEYLDELIKRDGRWYFSRRTIRNLMSAG
jgi:hypothetical protein